MPCRPLVALRPITGTTGFTFREVLFYHQINVIRPSSSMMAMLSDQFAVDFVWTWRWLVRPIRARNPLSQVGHQWVGGALGVLDAFALRATRFLGSLSNDDADGNENATKQWV